VPDQAVIAVLGTFDSKGQEHRFLQEAIQARGLTALTINVGSKGPSFFPPDIDLRPAASLGRDKAIAAVIKKAREVVQGLQQEGKIQGIISAGGGSGTHLAASVFKVLPHGMPKVIVSTVAAHDMAPIVGTMDITMIHSVGDLLGLNSLIGPILDQAAAAVCAMARSNWSAAGNKRRIALTMFGFITQAAENIKARLEDEGFEVVAFHANGIGGLAMEQLAAQGRFDAILDLAPHELADTLKDGYCKLIGPGRLEPLANKSIPRLLVPGGLDCAVLEFTRENIPPQYQGQSIFFYDFRSAVRLSQEESQTLAAQLQAKLNQSRTPLKLLIPMKGWSEPDREGGPLYDPDLNRYFMDQLTKGLNRGIEIKEVDCHINEDAFADHARAMMMQMLD
jgi:uncharacterized protein (UPF0261 family)